MITVHYDQMYTSSREPELNLCADVYLPPHPAPVLLVFHGWHGTRISSRHTAELFAPKYVVVNVDMRGRGKSDGQPDVNGWELLDAVDAVRFVQHKFADHISDPRLVYALGGSGGGGNVYALLGKFPDMFAAGAALCGISDYAAWYRGDEVGEFRDDMDAWLGVHPDDAPDRYRSGSGIHLIENLVTPLFVVHGDKDPRVPVEMGRRYAARAAELNKPVTYIEQPGVGHDIDQAALVPDITRFFSQHTEPPSLPRRGFLQVGGYVQLRTDRLELPSLDHFAVIDYELGENGELLEYSLQEPSDLTVSRYRIDA